MRLVYIWSYFRKKSSSEDLDEIANEGMDAIEKLFDA